MLIGRLLKERGQLRLHVERLMEVEAVDEGIEAENEGLWAENQCLKQRKFLWMIDSLLLV